MKPLNEIFKLTSVVSEDFERVTLWSSQGILTKIPI